MQRLNETTLQSFAVSKQFNDNVSQETGLALLTTLAPLQTLPINSLDFYHTGELLVSGSNDESIHLYDCVSGRESKVLYSKKYGVDLVRFTKQKDSIVSASNNEWDHTLRHLSLKTNQYIRYFKGHRARVTALALSPKNDWFLSAALDSTIRLWDLRTNACQGVVRHTGRSAVQIDPTGAVFAVGAAANALHLFDCRHFDSGPFLNIELAHPHPCVGDGGAVQWTDLKFGADGATLLASTAGGIVYLLDAFNGELLQTFGPHVRNVAAPPPRLEAAMTPDGKYVLCGADDGSIAVYNAASGALVTTWRGHTRPIGALRFNPKMMMAASACNSLALWLPPDIDAQQ